MKPPMNKKLLKLLRRKKLQLGEQELQEEAKQQTQKKKKKKMTMREAQNPERILNLKYYPQNMLKINTIPKLS